jgi:Ser/Thr protein kinase RdoA (MazF antagonist)
MTDPDRAVLSDEEQDAIDDARALALAMRSDIGLRDSGEVASSSAVQGPHPYERLTPECVLDALESIGERCDGRLLALNSYENRVYLIGLEDGSQCVAKFYRPERWSDGQILEEHRFAAALAAAEIPAVPARVDAAGESLHRHDGFAFAVFDRDGGRAPELDRADTRQWLGRFIGRIHAIGAASAYVERPTLDRATFGFEPRDWVVGHRVVPEPLASAWAGVVEEALIAVAACDEAAAPTTPLRLHGDCHLGNVLWTEGHGNKPGGPHFVDFDDSRMGPALQDLWMLLSGPRDEMTRQLADLLEGYEQFHPFDPRELHRLEALRTLRMIHYSAWLARRWDDPAFPAAFPFFGSERYWQDQIAALREQIEAMEQPPLAP